MTARLLNLGKSASRRWVSKKVKESMKSQDKIRAGSGKRIDPEKLA